MTFRASGSHRRNQQYRNFRLSSIKKNTKCRQTLRVLLLKRKKGGCRGVILYNTNIPPFCEIIMIIRKNKCVFYNMLFIAYLPTQNRENTSSTTFCEAFSPVRAKRAPIESSTFIITISPVSPILSSRQASERLSIARAIASN